MGNNTSEIFKIPGTDKGLYIIDDKDSFKYYWKSKELISVEVNLTSDKSFIYEEHLPKYILINKISF